MSNSSQENRLSTSNMEINGGIGFYQPSHYVAAETVVDEHGNTHVSSQPCDSDRNNSHIRKTKSESNKDSEMKNLNKGITISPTLTCHRKWNVREKYLLAICALLFLSCVAFVLVAFTRDKTFQKNCLCSDPPVIHSSYLPQGSDFMNSQPFITLVCNVSSVLTFDPHKDREPVFWWTLPNHKNVSGNSVILDRSKGGGNYTCHVQRTVHGKRIVTSSSTVVVTGNSIPSTEVCLTGNCIQTAAQLLGSMDPSVDPCNNFFQYACGNWNKKNFIPEDRTSYNTFEKLYDELQLTLRALLEDSPKDYDSNGTLKAKVLYQSCVNVSQIEQVGDRPLRKLLVELGRWPVIDRKWSARKFVLEDVLGDMRGKYNAPILVDVWIGPDDKNSSINIIQLDEPALGMPSREYYLHDPDSIDVKAYLRYMCDVAVLLGANPDTVKTEMEKVLQFETVIANMSKPQSERHDTGARYNKMTIGDLQKAVPKFDWLRYFNKFLPVTVDKSEEIVVFAPDFLHDMVDLVEQTEKRVVSNFVLWRLILGFIPELTMSFQEARSAYRKVVQGVIRDKPRWNKCVEYLNERLGLATGAMFVHEKFRKESKDVALEMIGNLRAAFIDLLLENDWMDNETRAVAREKATAIKERIGYPDFILDPVQLDKKFETLYFEPDQYFENILRVERYDANRTMIKFRKPVKKDVWEQHPAVVNAFYNPNTNDIVFAAGMLQPPFYSEYFPKSLNYGGIGVVIGHEITHGFDDKGRQYDKDGNMKQWWKNETIQAFQKRTQCIIEQYSNVQLEQIGVNIDGKNTQGENIADNGGLKQAYRAYKMWEKEHGPEPLLPGLNMTHDQLFFLNFAQIWCGNMRDKAALEKIRTSAHSPGPIRARLPLANSEDFARAYSCPLGSRMNPIHKCSVW
ncbi:neprilysin-1-like [Mercenaria mercenaria]|uniref:neprilysin-1-like n=1 Tax=Mercenaria mercenaria TaxID=6596 RepID=UPI00234F53C1|nr:neprilysin-1-like [Mercenaria mercenaria]XP_053378897.1 neprilysin-1-like [Mercenaria mercenaria]